MSRLTIPLFKKHSTDSQEKGGSATSTGGTVKSDALCSSEYGTIELYNNQLKLNAEGSWERFLTLLSCSTIYEVFSTPSSTVISMEVLGRIAVHRPLNLEEVIIHLVEETGARLDLKKPYAHLEYLGWRIFVQLEPAGQLELTATRIQNIPPLSTLLDPLLAARILALLMAPSTIVIVGPPGSGKTTLLNSLTIRAARLWPHLHISVVEPVKELVLPGGWTSRMVGDVSTLIRLTTRYKRPDLLVVGELMTDDIWSFIEAGRSGVPTISTYHSPNIWKCLRSMADALSLHIPGANEATPLRYIDAFIITKRTLRENTPVRHVDSIYISDGQRLLPIYTETPSPTHLAEEDYMEILPSTTLLGPAQRLYTTLKQALKVKMDGKNYEKLPPLPIRELLLEPGKESKRSSTSLI